MRTPKIKWAAQSISGNRKLINDDSLAIYMAGNDTSTPLKNEGMCTIEHQDLIFAVSDGMGGAKAGDIASKIILKELAKMISTVFKVSSQGFNPDYPDLLEAAIQTTHEHINTLAAKKSKHKGMAATLTLAWVTPELMIIGHVGDSRLYINRKGKTSQITHDHTFAWKQFHEGKISEFQFRNHTKRSVLYDVVGGGHLKTTPQILILAHQEGDRFMLCSDGVVDGLNEKKIAHFMNQNLDSPSTTLHSIIHTAVDNSGEDDTTCIVFNVEN